MAKFGKWLGAGLGFAMGGPLGVLFGYLIGSMFDDMGNSKTSEEHTYRRGQAYTNNTTRGDFMFSLVVLVTAVMKADNKILRSELDYVKVFLLKNFSEDACREALQMIKKLSEQNIDLDGVCSQINFAMPQTAKEQLIYFLVGVAKADGIICDNEKSVLEQIASKIGLNRATYESIRSMYFNDTEADYKILGLTSSASNDEIKKAYRKLALENHPDKLAYLGEDVRKVAEEKFTKINVAYEKICKERNIV